MQELFMDKGMVSKIKYAHAFFKAGSWNVPDVVKYFPKEPKLI